jgi:alkylation response protein AidB-like acyl-CoA dehydrogenase
LEFTLTVEQQMLQDSVRRFVERTYDFESRAARAKSRQEGDPAHWAMFADNGWLAAALPEEFGGLGGSPIDAAVIARELGRGLVLEPYLGCAVLAAQTLAAGGSAAQKDRLLPGLASGTRRAALAYSEPASRGMPEPIAARARRVGASYLLDGRKSLVLGARGADTFIVSANLVDEHARLVGLTLFLVDGDSPGLARQALPLHDGTWAEELTLVDVAVDPRGLIGEPGQGLDALGAGLAHGIVALSAELVGVMERAIELTADHLKTRKQFGVAIGSFQALQHRIADMAAEMELARSMLFAALASIANEDPATRRRTLSAAKALIGRAARRVCAEAIQLHGGIGMTEEYAVGHYYKRAVVADLLLGSSERHEAACAASLAAA